MGNVLFCYDGPIYKNDEKYYTISFSNKVLERYHILGEKVNFLVRVNDVDMGALHGYTLIDNDFTFVSECESISSPVQLLKNYAKVVNKIKRCVLEVEFIVVRMPSMLGILCCKIAKKNKKKVIVEVVGNARETFFYHSFVGKILCVPVQLLVRRAIMNADYVSYLTKEYLQQVYPTRGKMAVCPNVMIDRAEDDIRVLRKKRNRNISVNAPIIIASVGSIDEVYKGHRYVIEAIAHLTRQNYNVEYRIVGSGNPERLERICHELNVSERVKFVGQLRHEAVPMFLDAVDIYIQPSLTEAQGRALIEAMSRGCLCLSSDVGGMRELLPSKYRFAKKSVEEIVEHIIDLISSSDEEKNEISERNFAVADEFAKDKVNSQRQVFYEDIRDESRRMNRWN